MEENENLDAFPARGPLRKTKKRHKLLRKNSEQRQKLFKIAMDKNQTKPEVFSKLEEELRSLSGEEKLKLVQERLALRNMVERYEAEERRRNFESREQTTDPVFGMASSSEVCFQTIFKEYLYFV